MTSPTSLTAGNILAVETSGGRGTLAVGRLQNGRLAHVAQVAWEKRAIHSEVATLELQKLLQQERLLLTDLSHIVVNHGPGSFTGLRVGVSLARTLSYALNLPIAALGTLSVLAAKNAADGESVFVAIKAIQDFYYTAGMTLTKVGPDFGLAPSSQSGSDLDSLSNDYTKVLIQGRTSGFLADLEARDLLTVLERWPDHSRFFSWKEVRPVYIRASEAEEKLLKGLLNREF